MKRLTGSQRRDFRPLVIDSSGLRRILELLSEAKTVEFVADGVQYDSIDEFVAESQGRRPRSVSIKASGPYLAVEFGPDGSDLYVSADDSTAVGLFFKLCSVIQEFERRPRFLYNWWF